MSTTMSFIPWAKLRQHPRAILEFSFSEHTLTLSANLISLSWKQILIPETCHTFQHYHPSWSLFHLFWPESLQLPTSSPLCPGPHMCFSTLWPESLFIFRSHQLRLCTQDRTQILTIPAGPTQPFHFLTAGNTFLSQDVYTCCSQGLEASSSSSSYGSGLLWWHLSRVSTPPYISQHSVISLTLLHFSPGQQCYLTSIYCLLIVHFLQDRSFVHSNIPSA